MAWGKRLLFLAALPQQHSRTCKCGKSRGQGQGNTYFLTCSSQFLQVSLEPIEGKAWTVGLSHELTQHLGSSAPSSWEKVCLLPHNGVGLVPVLAHTGSFHCSSSLTPKQCFPLGCPSVWLQPGTAAGLACSQGQVGPSGASPLLTCQAVTAS